MDKHRGTAPPRRRLAPLRAWTAGSACVWAVLGAGASLAKDIDLRTLSDAGGATEVDFCARPSPNEFSFPGHAFVIFAEHPVSGDLKVRAVGETVAPGVTAGQVVVAYFVGEPVAGMQAEENLTHVKQACLSVTVDRTIYNAAVSAARPTLTAVGIPDDIAAYAESYSLTDADCLSFLLRVAAAVKPAGLVVPDRAATDLPLDYIARLQAAN